MVSLTSLIGCWMAAACEEVCIGPSVARVLPAGPLSPNLVGQEVVQRSLCCCEPVGGNYADRKNIASLNSLELNVLRQNQGKLPESVGQCEIVTAQSEDWKQQPVRV